MKALLRTIAALVLAATCLTIFTSPASAHSLGSSSIWVTEEEGSLEVTVSFALETLDEALGTDYVDQADLTAYQAEVARYLTDHFTVTGADGDTWTLTIASVEREAVEGIESISFDVVADSGGEDVAAGYTLGYDAIIEVIDTHEAVVVLTDLDDEISTAGVITASSPSLTIGDGTSSVAVADMVRYGFDHVLEGADHLLFLLTLLLPAPLVATAGRWRHGPGAGPTFRKVVHVITAFTLGHSLTLIASTLGWVSMPSRPVEIVIALSVAVSAIHAIRPLARRGEELIAGGFGLVHGLAFAGILADLGLDGSTSLLTLLAFNVGVELSQLVTTLLVFPSLYALSRTRFGDTFRVAGASLALVAALGWAADRLGVFANPLAGIEDAAIEHPWRVVLGVAGLAAAATLADRGAPASDRDAAGGALGRPV